jgi:hypothetical protein
MQRDNRAVKMGKEEEVFSYRKETQRNIQAFIINPKTI